jgi:hypothetical protein
MEKSNTIKQIFSNASTSQSKCVANIALNNLTEQLQHPFNSFVSNHQPDQQSQVNLSFHLKALQMNQNTNDIVNLINNQNHSFNKSGYLNTSKANQSTTCSIENFNEESSVLTNGNICL